jgi:hypothetical protein
MKSIEVNAIITGIRSKVDRSLGLTVSTPELSTYEKALFMELQGLNTKMTIEPLDEKTEGVETIDKDIETKTASQRLRAVLFILYKQKGDGSFEDFYKTSMEKVIDHFKNKIDE